MTYIDIKKTYRCLQMLKNKPYTVFSSHAVSLTYTCCEEIIKVDKRITRFMLPIGINANMDATALYEVAVAVFIAQLNSMRLNWSQLFSIG